MPASANGGELLVTHSASPDGGQVATLWLCVRAPAAGTRPAIPRTGAGSLRAPVSRHARKPGRRRRPDRREPGIVTTYAYQSASRQTPAGSHRRCRLPARALRAETVPPAHPPALTSGIWDTYAASATSADRGDLPNSAREDVPRETFTEGFLHRAPPLDVMCPARDLFEHLLDSIRSGLVVVEHGDRPAAGPHVDARGTTGVERSDRVLEQSSWPECGWGAATRHDRLA